MDKKSSSKVISKIIFHQNRAKYILGVAFSIMTALFEVSLAFVLMALIDQSSKGGMKTVLQIVAIVCIATVTYVIVGILSTYMSSAFTKKGVYNLRSKLMQSIINKPLSEVSKRPTGAYISMLNNDLTTVKTNYIDTSISIIRNCVMVVVALIAMFYIQWILTFVVLATLILPLLVSAVFSKKMKKCQNDITTSNQSLNAMIKDVLSGIPVVKSFNIEKEIVKILNKKSDIAEDSRKNFSNTTGLQSTIMTLISLLIIVVIFTFGALFTIKGQMTMGGIIAFVQLLNNLTAPISNVFTSVTKRKSCNAIFDLFIDVMQQQAYTEKNIKISGINNCISVDKLSFAVDDKTEILHNITYKFEKGKSYAIVGLSGSGKSTLLSLLAGYYDNYSGSIKIDDSELRKISEASLYNVLSLVQQESFIFNDTIENNIKLFKDWPESDVNNAIESSCLLPLIKDRGADYACGENGSQLSGGERQRVSIARALLRKSPILLLDEATSSLDVNTAAAIEENLTKLGDVTRIVITHRLDEAILRKYDSIIMMQDGEIKESGTYDELVQKKGHFYALIKVNS
jgi:ATP-binding cassette subfamily B protein